MVEITGPVESLKHIADKLRAASIQPEEAGLRMIPNQEIELSVDQTLSVMRTIESLEELDDVQDVYTNLKISEEAMAALEAE
jgi:transcriptional/translational regulatory protein YebC/TACO1